MKVQTITPNLAEHLLNHHAVKRDLSVNHINFLADMMKDGRWIMSDAPIRLNSAGQVTDGQHRLSAVVVSGTTQHFLVD